MSLWEKPVEHNGARFTGVYSVCQGQVSNAPLEMSKEQRNTDICVHSELISDVFWPRTWVAEKKQRQSPLFLQRRGKLANNKNLEGSAGPQF